MTEIEVEKEYWWEINAFYENGGTADDLINLLTQVYRGGFYDGLSEAKDKDYD